MGKHWQHAALLLGCMIAVVGCGTTAEKTGPGPSSTEETNLGRAPQDEGTSPAASMQIQATTKRLAAGLDEPLPGYLSWAQLDERISSELAVAPFMVAREAYLTYVFTAGAGLAASGPIQGGLKAGSIVLREVRAPHDDFIQEVFVLRVEEDGSKTEVYTRTSATEGFQKVLGAAVNSRGHGSALEALAQAKELPILD
jgi:hypothetical protein